MHLGRRNFDRSPVYEPQVSNDNEDRIFGCNLKFGPGGFFHKISATYWHEDDSKSMDQYC